MADVGLLGLSASSRLAIVEGDLSHVGKIGILHWWPTGRLRLRLLSMMIRIWRVGVGLRGRGRDNGSPGTGDLIVMAGSDRRHRRDVWTELLLHRRDPL